MIKNKLLYLNLSVDSSDTSLGFVETWISNFLNDFDKIDVITLNKSMGAESLSDKLKIYGINQDSSHSKIKKFLKLRNIIKNLTRQNNYDVCFSHMSPLLSILVKLFCVKNIQHNILWYTHPKPKELSKKIILLTSLLINDRVVTASNSSFPYKGKKVSVIGHGIDYKLFYSVRNSIPNNNFLILSRITKTKNIELSIDSFLKSKFCQNTITIIGDPVTQEDIKYKNYLINKYSAQNNVIFKGKVPHKNLPSLLKDYSFHINSTAKGFYDKSVLETLSAGLFNFYSNQDYNKHFNSKVTPLCYFPSTEESLILKLNTVFDKNNENLIEIIKMGQLSVGSEDVETISKRILSTIEN